MIKKLISKKIDSVGAAAFLVAMSSLFSRLLGLLRDRILAGHFGAGNDLDVYYAAFRVPDLLYNLIVLGALSAGFIPIFTSIIKDQSDSDEVDPEAWRLTNGIINILGLALLLIGIVGSVFAPALIKAITPGFSADKIQLTAKLSQVMFLSPLLLGLSAVCGGVLQSFKRFFIYSLSPIFYNLGIIFGALFLTPKFGVYGLAWGVVLGSLLHFSVQLPTVFSLGYRWKAMFGFRDKNIQNIFKMMTARTMSLAITQMDLLVTTYIASMLAGGTLAIFNLANNLQSFPIGIFGISFAIAVFPTLSINAFNRKKLVDIFSETLSRILFFIIPFSALFFVLAERMVRVCLSNGNFDSQAVFLTASALKVFSLSFIAQATVPLLTRVFYARHNSKTPFYVGLFSVVVDVVGCWYAGERWGVSGLALAFLFSNTIDLLALWLILRSELGGLNERKLFKIIGKYVLSALVLALVSILTLNICGGLLNKMTTTGALLEGVLAGGLGFIAYLFTTAALGCEEYDSFKKMIIRKLPWKKIKIEDQGEARGV